MRSRRCAQQWHIKSHALGLLIERTLHQRVRHDADNSSPRLRLTGIEDSDLVTNRALVAPIFSGKTRIHNCHRLFRIDIVDGEITAFENFQTKRREIIVRDRFEISARAIPIGEIILTVNFVLALAVECHAEATAHRGGLELGIGPQSAHGTLEKFAPRIFTWIRALHQSHPRSVNGIFVVPVVQLHLISDRFDFERRGDQ